MSKIASLDNDLTVEASGCFAHQFPDVVEKRTVDFNAVQSIEVDLVESAKVDHISNILSHLLKHVTVPVHDEIAEPLTQMVDARTGPVRGGMCPVSTSRAPLKGKRRVRLEVFVGDDLAVDDEALAVVNTRTLTR